MSTTDYSDWAEKSGRQRAIGLCGTSVQDLQSSLSCYRTAEDLVFLRVYALPFVVRRREKTKVAVLKAKIHKLERALAGGER